ncbi:MAG TPA: DUF2065 domain-containing protein [Steroidobacteraceae bacterium]|nr:DUF2065 domain-containing protein [Steroidobacteraceae bacterium]
MKIDWHDLGTAFALYLVLEGLLPFLSPAFAQRAFRTMAQAGSGPLRLIGLGSMLAGCALLYWIRG